MTWFGWVLIGLQVTAVLIVISEIGKPVKPMTPRQAALIFVVRSATVVAILAVGTGSL